MTKRDPLGEYNAKRDFKRTAEPAGVQGKHASGNRFIVQKHAATRLHWDLRLEADGVLKSWAVTKGPSADPDIKRLAVRTEDHPLAYAEFEGTIPKGEYGGGSVMLWDRGTWEPVAGKSWHDLEQGHLHFILHGERMKGEWLLIRLKPRAGEKRENWLLRKLEDRHVQPGDRLVEESLTSVLTGRAMAEIAADRQGSHSLEGKSSKAFAREMAQVADHVASVKKPVLPRRKPVSPPAFRPPQLATLVDRVPEGNGWMHEIKFDGYRAQIALGSSELRVWTRSGKDWTDKFGPLVGAIEALGLPPCLIDGEIVADDVAGNPDFSALQAVLKRGHRSQQSDEALSYHAFDLLELEGDDLRGLPNIERKERLEALLATSSPPIHVADHVIGAGEKLYEAMCRAGQEGIISKAIDAPYVGRRSRNWVKVKCTLRQEFVVIGWKPSSAGGRMFASLLLAQHEDGDLVYKGNVGTGFNAGNMAELTPVLRRLERKSPPADVPRTVARNVHWVTPQLVVEVAFAEFTADGKVRHGSFIGMRQDKPAAEVRPEKAMAVDEPNEPTIRITNRDRVIFPETGQTKGQLAEYYRRVAPLMLPFAAQRPLSLVRCPQGRARKCFFQKHDSGSFGPDVHHVPIREKSGAVEDYLYIEDARGLLSCVQMGTIEFHGWAARSTDVEAPDRLVFDLDPDEELDFSVVKRAAEHIRDSLADLGLVSFAMLSGGKGIHVVVPLSTGHGWEQHADFAKRFAEALSLAEPDRFVATISKAKRKGRILIDWLRNQRGSTAVLPYSARAREGAPVAVPLTWDELKDTQSARMFSIADVDALLDRAGNRALSGWGFAAQGLPDF
ncbi:MAG: DNA ligase D [Novosphingobium sp.]